MLDLPIRDFTMEHPPCPACDKGRLLPMSTMNAPFGYWVCSAPTCTYVISGNSVTVRYHKCHAVTDEKAKGDKEWTEFSF